jgi:hypothetical protein
MPAIPSKSTIRTIFFMVVFRPFEKFEFLCFNDEIRHLVRTNSQLIGWDRGRPARNAPQARQFSLLPNFGASRSLRAGRPRPQPIT